MKRWATGAAMILSAPVLAQAPAAAPAPVAPSPAAPLEGGANFISPMGEPFRSTDGLSGAEHWFRQADANHDGKITPEEMKADADRFFALLDTDHDGIIGPDELTRYETEVAPEIQVASSVGDLSKGKTDDEGHYTPPPYPTRLGAGRLGYLDMPEPVVAADTNFDRGVSKQEFENAAVKRLRMLDTDGDGALTRAELPKLSAKVKADDGSATENGHKRHGGGGRHGSVGGAGMSGGPGGF